jgi:photosystem II stability/assembly factor-like uncharacterized protein
VRTIDGGRHWSGLARLRGHEGRSLGDFRLSVAFPGPNAGFIDVDGKLFRTLDAGRHWQRVRGGCPRDLLQSTSITFPTASTGFLSCDGEGATDMSAKHLLGTSDAGASWRVVSHISVPGSGEPDIGKLPIVGNDAVVTFASPSVGYLTAERNGLLRSTDGGVRFRELLFADDQDSITGTSWVSDEVGYVSASQSGLIGTTDGGAHWHLVRRGSAHWSPKEFHVP